MKYERKLFTFEDYEESSYNAKWDMWGVNGTNIYYNGKYVGDVEWKTAEDFENMTDEELEEVLDENGIII